MYVRKSLLRFGRLFVPPVGSWILGGWPPWWGFKCATPPSYPDRHVAVCVARSGAKAARPAAWPGRR